MRRLPILLTAAAALALPALGTAAPSTTIGTGTKTCVLKPGADCRGVVHHWAVEHHGNLKKAKFTKADLRGVDFRGANLRGADFRGANLRHADFRGAKLANVRMGPFNGSGGSRPKCYPNCAGADLTGADLSWTDSCSTDFTKANLTGANLQGAWLYQSEFSQTNLSNARMRVVNRLETMTCSDQFLPNMVMDFEGATMIRTDLQGALASASILEKANMTGALVDSTTDFGSTTPPYGSIFGSTTCPSGAFIAASFIGSRTDPRLPQGCWQVAS